MFLKLFLLPLTLYIFLFGYILSFIGTLIKGLPIVNILWSSFVGGVGLVAIWSFCLLVLIRLLTKQELAYYFSVEINNTPINNSYNDHSYTTDDDELTIDELYSPNNLENNHDEAPLHGDFIQQTTEPESPKKKSDFKTKDIKMDVDGQFNLSVDGKTVRATPKEGASAIRKLLTDDKKLP